jgi:uncharacterized iron-regulated membrane protein
MIRKTFFWLHLVAGITAGLFIFIMAATGVILSFERQITEFLDRDIRSVSAPSEAQPRPLNEQLAAVRRTGIGNPTAIAIRNHPQATTEFTIDRNKTLYVDPYSGAVLGTSSTAAHQFFSTVEKAHRSLGAPLGSKNVGHWLTAISNLLFAILILLGVFLWLPRKWNTKSVRAIIAFKSGLRAKAREWNWHNVIGIWCALPLLVIALTGVVMSFDWANALLFRITGSTPAPSGRRGGDRPSRGQSDLGQEPDYDKMLVAAKALNSNWRTITLNLARDSQSPLTTIIDTGSGEQPQDRTQYILNRETSAVTKTISFSDSSLGQKLRTFVRFGHTGEYFGLIGQAIAAIASLGACILVYTGLSLAFRRFAALWKRKRAAAPVRQAYAGQPVR